MKNNMLDQYKAEYEQMTMSDLDLQKYKNRIEQAKKENQEERDAVKVRRGKNGFKIAVATTAACAALVIAPNVSSNVAYAMGNIPLLGNLIQVVTFRDYSFEDANHKADVTVAELDVDTDKIENAAVKENVIRSSAEINSQIKALCDQWVDAFKAEKKKDGASDLQISSEVLHTTDSFFTLKIVCYQSEADGYEEHHYYTIDLNSGKRLTLKDLFWEDADYVTKISDEIKAQMRVQMAEDSNVKYFLDSDLPEEDFDKISDETEFYINENGELVISFNEMEVAPASMGCVEFVMEGEEIRNLRKPATGLFADGMITADGQKEETFANFDEVIDSLEKGSWYTELNLSTAENPVLLVTDYTYDNLDGNMAAIGADIYTYNENHEIMKYGHIQSCGTACPIATDGSYLYYAGHHYVGKVYAEENCSALITKEEASEVFDEEGNVSYYAFSLDDGFAGSVEDDSKLAKLFEEFFGAKIINFTEKK